MGFFCFLHTDCFTVIQTMFRFSSFASKYSVHKSFECKLRLQLNEHIWQINETGICCASLCKSEQQRVSVTHVVSLVIR